MPCVGEFGIIDKFKKDKYRLIDGIDRIPPRMIDYQLGWMNIIFDWENQEQPKNCVLYLQRQNIKLLN